MRANTIIVLSVVVLCVLVQSALGQVCSATTLCQNNLCCSQWGYCGSTVDYCGIGCKSGPCAGKVPTATPKPATPATPKPSTPTTAPSSWPGGPLKAIYIDIGIDWSNPASTFRSVVDSGYNLVILAFFVSGVAKDAAIAWDQMGAANQQSTIAYARARNARIIVSAGGATDTPYSQTTGTAYGQAVANWAKARYLDGVDFDLENFGSGFTSGSLSTSATIAWVAAATNAARNILGASAIITHAPQPPYFGNNGWANGYAEVYKQASSINFLLIQFYNNGPTNTYQSVFVRNNGMAINEIATALNGAIPLNKLVVGKPVISGDASPFNTASEIRAMVVQAQSSLGWNAGVMGWQWHDPTTNSQWIKTIYP